MNKKKKKEKKRARKCTKRIGAGARKNVGKGRELKMGVGWIYNDGVDAR